MFNKFFFRLSIHASSAKIQPDNVVRWCQDGDFCVLNFQRAACSTFQTCILNSHGHTMFGSMVDIQSSTAEIRRGKKEEILVGRSSPYCVDMSRRYCCLTIFFPIVDTCRGCEDIARQRCGMVHRWRFLATFLRPVFAASPVQHISDLHSKFALGPRHV